MAGAEGDEFFDCGLDAFGIDLGEDRSQFIIGLLGGYGLSWAGRPKRIERGLGLSMNYIRIEGQLTFEKRPIQANLLIVRVNRIR